MVFLRLSSVCIEVCVLCEWKNVLFSLQNDQLIRDSGEGDLMIVTSLLNSGADIQALNNVGEHLSLYILIAIWCNKIVLRLGAWVTILIW